MLTQRQIRLLMLLAAADGWVTAQALSRRLSVSDKLVKQEVAALRVQLGELIEIESSPRQGYVLRRMDDEVRAGLARDFDAHAGHHSVRRRYAQVLLMLLCAEEPLTMAQIAGRLYIAKATVAEQIEMLRYRLGRLPNLELAVSQRYGIAIVGTELERRYEASKWIGRDRLDALGLEGESAERFWRERERVARVLGESLAEPMEAGRISGEDVGRIASWCVVSALRDGAGHELVGALPQQTDADAQAWAQRVRPQLGLALSERDEAALAQLFYELVVPSDPSTVARAHAAQLLAEVQLAADCPFGGDPALKRQRIAARIEGVMRRTAAGHNALNWHASETVARYPLESYLAVGYADRMLEWHIPKSEAMLIALGIAGTLERVRDRAHVVLYTDENAAVIGHIRAQLRAHWGERLRIERVFSPSATPVLVPGTVELATDPSAIIWHPRVMVLPALPSAEDIAEVDRALLRRRAQTLKELSDRLVLTLTAAPELPRGSTTLTCYRTVCAISEVRGAEASRIEVWPLKPEALYHAKRYRRAICVRWNREELGAFEFFEVLANLLSQELKDAR